MESYFKKDKDYVLELQLHLLLPFFSYQFKLCGVCYNSLANGTPSVSYIT